MAEIPTFHPVAAGPACRASTRRGFLGAGGTTVFVASGGLITAACSVARPGPAYAPWALWNDPAVRGSPLALVAAGVLAANPHDTQPWLFHVQEGSIEVFADTSRNLGAMDPFLREMHIGLGCALENMALAAPANGYGAEIETIPGSVLDLKDRHGPAHAATVRLTRLESPQSPSSAYHAIPRRHTNRFPYDRRRPPPRAWRDTLAAPSGDPGVRLFLFDEGAGRTGYDSVVIDATKAIISDAAMIADSDRWFRGDDAEIEKYRSGPTLAVAGLSPMNRLLAGALPLPPKVKHDAWLAQTRDSQLASAPLTGLIAVRDRYDRAAAMAVGRLWQRIHLAAADAGVALQPLNQPMEMVDRDRSLGRGDEWERRLAALTGSPDWQATFSFRAGVCSHPASASPRRALSDTIIA
ncbi:MAG: hypothetical protein P4L73_16705 [Caulobacteraceae bacterium]|nr:hypothetical protein [Caulobacteraceae bacterium]